MSGAGGQLVVLDRLGRDGKRYPLARGLATLGSDHACDIRVMLPAVRPHHATVAVHKAQTVVRNVGGGATLVNGRAVSVAALRHGDVIALGGRALRWEYAEPPPAPAPPPAPRDQPAAYLCRAGPAAGASGSGRRGARRGSVPAPAARDRALQLALELTHRASMPGSAGGKQVAIVQPQRRDTSEQAERNAARASPQAPASTRRTKSESNASASETGSDKSRRKSAARASPKNLLQNTTKATLWIESRKTSPRKRAPQLARRSVPASKSTPLRLTVLKRAQSARKVVKIEAPLKIDHTKQAAIMLMTGHTPKSKLSISPQSQSKKKSPSYVVKKPSPVRKTPRGKGRQSGRRSKKTDSDIGVTPSTGSSTAQDSSNRRSSKRNSGNQSVTVLEITDSTQNSTIRASDSHTRSRKSSRKSPALSSPKKSAMKDHSKKSTRKTESIKFDLSNLESHQDSNDVLLVTNTTQNESDTSMTEEDLTLHYSDSSNQSPSPRKSINSRSSRMLASVGASMTPTASSTTRTLTPESPRARRSIRGSMMVQKSLETSKVSDCNVTERSANATGSAFRTRTLSPRSTRNMESYSVVDLVSLDSNESSASVYDSAGSTSTADFGTPNGSARRTRSTINPTLLGSSTPYVGGTRTTRSKSSSSIHQNKSTRSSASSRRSKSLSTPENKTISVNSTRVSRATRSRSRINDSDLLLLDETEVEDSSPKTSRRSRTTKSVTKDISTADMTANSTDDQGTSTPENRRSPEPVGTPVLSIQSLLDSSQSSLTSHNSGRRGMRSTDYKRKTIGVLSEPKRREDKKSKSLGSSVRKTWLRLSRDSSELSDKTDEGARQPDSEETVTPKSAVKISPEAVKNKHSTAKKPLSKRTIIDDLNQSDIVKQLFNSPVKRKLSQSMTEFSRKQLFDDDDDDIVLARRPTRNTVALTGRSPNSSILEQTEAITPERFVSPINTPTNSPNLSGLRRLFKGNTPENDSRNVRGAEGILRTSRTRRSTRNDLTNVHGVKAVFAVSPNNDLRRVSGVKSLFQLNTSPKNDLTDVRGVRKMFKRKSPENDLRNVSGVKRILRNATPKNDLTDVRGVRRMFRQQKQKESYHDVSGIEELFDVSNQSENRSETLFDALVGKPRVKSVYSKTFSTKLTRKPNTRKGKSLHSSIDVVTNNVEEWLEQELQKRLHRGAEPSTSKSNNSRNVTMKELQKLATETVDGAEPIRTSRTRNSSYRGKKSASEIYSAHTLPIKKRSIIESSLEKSKHQLPIKKRVVVHSTPVKGKVNITMNASELGRVSPIAAVDKTREADHQAAVTRSTQIVTAEKHKGAAKARTPRKQETPKKIEISKPSPEKPIEKQTLPKRVTRNRKITNTSGTNTKKRRTSIVVTKKPPGMSPKGNSTDTKEMSHKPSPKKTRATRSKNEEKSETPKRTRARAAKATLVVTKRSPQLKPESTRKVAEKSQTTEQKDKPKRTRKTAIDAKAGSSSVSSPKNNRKNRMKSDLLTLTVEEPVQAKKGRKTVEREQPVQTKRGRKTNAMESSVQEGTKTRGKKTPAAAETKSEENQRKVRGKKVEAQTSVESEPTTRGRGRRAAPQLEQTVPTTRRRKLEVVTNDEIVTKTRGKKLVTQTSVESETSTRTRRTKAEDTVAPDTTGRKRKAAATKELPSKLAKTEPKKSEISATETTKRQKRAGAKGNKAENSEQAIAKSTRGRRSKQVEEVKKPVRGQKAAEPQEIVAMAARSKRKANVEPSPAKAAKKPARQPGGDSRALRGAASQPAGEGRALRGAASQPAGEGRALRGAASQHTGEDRARRGAARGHPQPEVATQAVGRSRRR